jgi:hypothetical protein
VFHKAEGQCQLCRKYLPNNFIAHHVSSGAYRRIGRERFNQPLPKWAKGFFRMFGIKKEFYKDDVIAVCRNCHDGPKGDRLHENINVPYWARKNQNSSGSQWDC